MHRRILHWDWMHNICASSGIAQYEIQGFVVHLVKNTRFKVPLLDDFTNNCRFPKRDGKLSKTFWNDRISSEKDGHIKSFASEAIMAVQVLVLFSELRNSLAFFP